MYILIDSDGCLFMFMHSVRDLVDSMVYLNVDTTTNIIKIINYIHIEYALNF